MNNFLPLHTSYPLFFGSREHINTKWASRWSERWVLIKKTSPQIKFDRDWHPTISLNWKKLFNSSTNTTLGKYFFLQIYFKFIHTRKDSVTVFFFHFHFSYVLKPDLREMLKTIGYNLNDKELEHMITKVCWNLSLGVLVLVIRFFKLKEFFNWNFLKLMKWIWLTPSPI